MSFLTELTIYSRMMLAVCALLGLVVAAEAVVMSRGARPSDSAVPAGSDDLAVTATRSVQPLHIPPIVTYREIMERPLFSDTRRPQDKPAPATEAIALAQLDNKWKLTGVVVSGENSSAHVAGVRDNKTQRLQVGMSLDGWRLEKIMSDHVVFSQAGRTATLRLHDDEEQPVAPIKRR